MPEPARPEDLAAVVALIVGEQPRPERMIPSLGDEPDGVRAELDALEPPWAETVRLVRDEDGSVAGAVLVEMDHEVGQAWVLGPWVAGGDDAWDRSAGPLLDAALAQVPATLTGWTLTGHVANARLAALARQRRWTPSQVNHVLVADRSVVDAWADAADAADAATVRPATPADLAAVEVLHEADFAGTYATAEQLLRGGGDDAPVVLVVDDPDLGVIGYAAGRIQPDGEGYIDFVAVTPSRRGAGVGRQLVVALTRQLIARAAKGQVGLTVRDERAAARALYGRLGFRTLLSMVGYSAGPGDGSSGGAAS